MIHKNEARYSVSRFTIPTNKAGLVGIHEVHSLDFTALFLRTFKIESRVLNPFIKTNGRLKQPLMRFVRHPKVEPN